MSGHRTQDQGPRSCREIVTSSCRSRRFRRSCCPGRRDRRGRDFRGLDACDREYVADVRYCGVEVCPGARRWLACAGSLLRSLGFRPGTQAFPSGLGPQPTENDTVHYAPSRPATVDVLVADAGEAVRVRLERFPVGHIGVMSVVPCSCPATVTYGGSRCGPGRLRRTARPRRSRPRQPGNGRVRRTRCRDRPRRDVRRLQGRADLGSGSGTLRS